MMDGYGKRVLVVEDDDDVRTLFGVILRETGYNVYEACDGLEAIDALKKRRYDVLLGRHGGEEFVLLLPGEPPTHAAELAERLRAVLATSPLAADGQLIALTASIGVATAGPDTDLDALLDEADQAQYAAKHAGRNRVVLHAALAPAETESVKHA